MTQRRTRRRTSDDNLTTLLHSMEEAATWVRQGQIAAEKEGLTTAEEHLGKIGKNLAKLHALYSPKSTGSK